MPALKEDKMPVPGPGLYGVLQAPRNASSKVIEANYDSMLCKVREATDLAYDGPTAQDKLAKKAWEDKLRDAARILLDPFEREKYDDWLDAQDRCARPSQARRRRRNDSYKLGPRQHSVSLPDTWIAARDGRSWPTPPRRKCSHPTTSPKTSPSTSEGTKTSDGRASPSYNAYGV